MSIILAHDTPSSYFGKDFLMESMFWLRIPLLSVSRPQITFFFDWAQSALHSSSLSLISVQGVIPWQLFLLG